jgi:hypothetical protein
VTNGADASPKSFQAGMALLVLPPFAYWVTGWVEVLPLMLVGFVLSVNGLWMLAYP